MSSRFRPLRVDLIMLLAVALSVSIGAAPVTAGVHDLNGRPVDPLRAAGDPKAVVLVFTSIECPISNRYAPEVRRLHERFAPAGVRVWLVFPNPADDARAIREHLRAFQYPAALRPLIDARQELVRLTRATVTPEAAVFDRRGAMVYRGRIDDRYADLSVDRMDATTHDLEEAIAATLAGKPVSRPMTAAIGCFIPDVRP